MDTLKFINTERERKMTEQEQRNDIPTQEQQPLPNNAEAYVENVRKIKEGMVDRGEYERVLNENKTLMDSIAFGKKEEVKVEVVDTPKQMAQLRKELYGNNCENLLNLDYWVKTLQLREDIMKQGGDDPFVANGINISGTPEDYAAAQRVADVVSECIDEAGGDSQVFTALLQQRTKDVRMR